MVAMALTAPATFRESITVVTVTSSEQKTLYQHTNVEPGQLREALEMSLQKAGYLSVSPAAATLQLTVALVSLEPGGAGVVSHIRYTLASRAREATLFDEVVIEDCGEYAFWSWERVQHSTECSVRKNIQAFLQKTLRLQTN